jgi:hypothetical protein
MKKSLNLFMFILILFVATISLIGLSPGIAGPFDEDNTIKIDPKLQSEEGATGETESSPAAVSEDEVIIAPPDEPEVEPTAALPTEEDEQEVAASSAPEPEEGSSKILPGYEEQDISIGGDNYCGQFAMTSVFKGLGIDKEAQDVYKATNPAGIFTAPPVIVGYLNKNGVKARQRQNCSIDDIVKKIDAGTPVMVLVDSGDGTPHWVNIYGYNRDASGKIITGWTNRDWGQLAGGASKLVLGIPGAVVSIGSRVPTALGSMLSGWGKDRMRQGGVGNSILGGAAVAGGSVLQAGGWVANQVGNLSSSVAKGIGNGIKSLFGR